jgi:hypothetical protein
VADVRARGALHDALAARVAELVAVEGDPFAEDIPALMAA